MVTQSSKTVTKPNHTKQKNKKSVSDFHNSCNVKERKEFKN